MAVEHRHDLESTPSVAGSPVDHPAGRGTDPPERPARFLTVAEVAALLRVSTMTVYRQIQAGELAAVRVGKSYRLRAADVDEWIAECVVVSPTES